ncbi:ExbD/TolR family protein [Sphingobacterium wenxiniae]|uniref:Biopolymer transport protein ExbD/TolR n=1 Tax=Sphingobacterium wenxiniae TaxID=683125 RepID=A0A1I6SFY0_9SPHI|nr:biopolymer transporter ExbD [Sphingobacterium wenxiniae]SFS75833.1 Biopolymer transport protein ExbD/TolR [Sphingobacterium wenxiniae]
MAELNNNLKNGGKTERRNVRNRPVPKVDLTAMVDLAFLLITFFMLTTSLNTPNQLDVAMPDKIKEKDLPIEINEKRTLSLLLGANNEITYYRGREDNPERVPQIVGYGKLGLRELLLKTQKEVLTLTEGEDMIVLIKPGDASVTRNLVDVLDEVQNAQVKRYMITKMSETEKDMM